MEAIRSGAERIKNRFISWDFFVAIAASGLLYLFLPEQVYLGFALDLYVTGITVLTMCIFYFLAFIALVASVSDAQFLSHLKKDRGIVEVFRTYKYTVIVLFVALFINLILYGVANFQKYLQPDLKQSRFFFMAFLFVFVYGMLTVFEATLDSVDIVRLRVRFLLNRHEQPESNSESPPGDQSSP